MPVIAVVYFFDARQYLLREGVPAEVVAHWLWGRNAPVGPVNHGTPTRLWEVNLTVATSGRQRRMWGYLEVQLITQAAPSNGQIRLDPVYANNSLQLFLWDENTRQWLHFRDHRHWVNVNGWVSVGVERISEHECYMNTFSKWWCEALN